METKRNSKIFKTVLAGLLTAVLAVCSQLVVTTPFGIPLTLQIFAVALSGCVLGAKWSAATVAVYIILGAFGLPVFSGFKGGLQVLFGAGGGFIIGFIFIGFFVGLAYKSKKVYLKFLFSITGLLICHLIGVIQFSLIAGIDFLTAFLSVSFPFILKDIVLILLSFKFAKYINKRLL